MAVQRQVSAIVAYKKETTFGTIAGTSGAQILRRVSSDFALKKSVIESKEKRTDQQIVDVRHAQRSVDGSLKGELSTATYSALIGSVLKRDFTTQATILIAASTTWAASGVGPMTFTRAAGSNITDGVKVGMMFKPSAGNNSGKLFTVIAVTATVLTVAETVVTQAATAMDIVFTGKVTYIPETGHTNDSYTLENWYPDVTVSHRFTGCRFGSVEINSQPNAATEITLAVMGQDRSQAAAQYFVSPTAATGTAMMSGAAGKVIINGTAVGTCTGWNLKVDAGMSGVEVVGANITPDIFSDTITVKGQVTILFDSAVTDTYFDAETAITLVLKFDDGNNGGMSFAMPRVKLAGGSISGDKQLAQQFDFTALKNDTGTGADKTTLFVQDTGA